MKDLIDQFTVILIEEVKNEKNIKDLCFKVKSKNKSSFHKAVDAIKTWKIVYKRMSFSKDEYKQLIDFKKEINNLAKKFFENSIDFQDKNCQIFISSPEVKNSQKMFNIIEKTCLEKVDCKKEFKAKTDLEFELISKALKNKNFIKKNNLELIEFEYLRKFRKIIMTGKKIDLDKVNIQKILEVFSSENTSYKLDQKIVSFAKSKLQKFKKSLFSDLILLKFDIANDGLLSYEVFGFDEDEVRTVKNDLLENFLHKATSDIIDLNLSKDLIEIEKLVLDYKKNSNEDSANDDDDSSEDGYNEYRTFHVNVEIYFDKKSKKIYLNGTNKDEIKETKSELLEKINGSKKCTKFVKYSSLVFKKFTKSKIINDLKTKYSGVNFFVNYDQNLIRMNGLKEQIESSLKEINQFCANISNQIVVSSIQVNKSEYSYLQKNQHEIKKLEKETNSIVHLDTFERYAWINMNNGLDIELIHGDFKNLNVDVYVNPANNKLECNGGLAKTLLAKAGKNIANECNKYIRDHGQMMEGDVFVTGSGNLGVKSNSIIVHAVEPIWCEGLRQEESTLIKIIKNSLEKADEKYKLTDNKVISIAIPAISTEIFKYPVRNAVNIISEAVFKYIDQHPNSKIKQIKFISNLIETVKEWEEVLNNISIKKSLAINASNKYISKDLNWFWKDDDGKWKTYLQKYSRFIQSNFEKGISIFDLNLVENGILFSINLIARTKINKNTGFVHEISDNIPVEQHFQWYWEDDNKNHSPYSKSDSEVIEKAFLNNQKFVELSIKRYDTDLNDNYNIIFEQKNSDFISLDSVPLAVQINLRTSFKRHVFREQSFEHVDIVNEDSKENVKADKVLYFTIHKDSIKQIESKLKKMIQDSYVKIKMDLTNISKEILEEFESDYDAKIMKNDGFLIIEAIKENAIELKSKILEIAIQGTKFNYPKEWAPMEPDSNFKMVELDSNHPEYKLIINEISKTMSNSAITKIERIQNKWLWKLYSKSLEALREKSGHENEEWLFHGTKSNEPEKVYKGEIGFDMRFSNQGMWGTGIYFAVNASYSSGYAFKNSDDSNSFLYAKVAIGETIYLPSNNTYRLPPLKPKQENSNFYEERYDSIKGNTGGSDIYIVYENCKAYPQYLITFR